MGNWYFTVSEQDTKDEGKGAGPNKQDCQK